MGWVVVGEVCLGTLHKPDTISVLKTILLSDGRCTIFDPCENSFQLKDTYTQDSLVHDYLYDPIFQRSKDDNKVGLSIEDRQFLKLMDSEFRKDANGHWIAPLPFRTPKPAMPNNREQAMKRAKSLHLSLQRDPDKRTHFVTFMEKVISSGAAEEAPPPVENREYWYLPIFGVYHPRKPGQIRGVFDSSAVHSGISLNNVLMSGPDLSNNLLGIL